jgi:hypothetical protein
LSNKEEPKEYIENARPRLFLSSFWLPPPPPRSTNTAVLASLLCRVFILVWQVAALLIYARWGLEDSASSRDRKKVFFTYACLMDPDLLLPVTNP